MSNPEAAAVEIYVGDSVQHESERSTLKEIERFLSDEKCPAILFANFSAASVQIDFLVALKGLALIIEAKASTRSVKGGENGPWKVHLATGDWKNIRNPYVQALDAVFALKDAMRAFRNFPAPYIDAAVVFAPTIPHGSQILPSNRKVSVMGHDGLSARLRMRDNNAWSLNEWRTFAKHLSLTRVSSVSAACDPGLVKADGRIEQYTATFCRAHHEADKLVSFSGTSEGKVISSGDVVRLVSEPCGDFLFHGPTGCGKSMLAASSGTAFVRQSGVALTLQSKEFNGSVKRALDREACLLGAASAGQLLNDARLLDKPILFIIDGYNECAPGQRRLLTRGIAALAHRYEARILVTSQIPLVRGDLLDLQKIDVPPPSIETKAAIAKQASKGKASPEGLAQVLAAVSTGLEARLAGEVGAAIRPGSSRYALFDAYARKRLGNRARECTAVLSSVADWLCDRLVFSMSVRDLDRLLDSSGVDPTLGQLILDKEMLTLRGDSVSFPHEMFFDAFAAEAVVRQAKDRPELVLKALASPLHAGRKDLVIGAIDDDRLLERLLPSLEDYASVKNCLLGRCGSHVQEWAQRYCREMWIRMRDEASEARFRIEKQEFEFVQFEPSSLGRWSPCDRAFFALMPELITKGSYLDEALEVVGILDQRIAEERVRLRGDIQISDFQLRDRLFAISYAYPSRSDSAPGICAICADVNHGIAIARSGQFQGPDKMATAEIMRKMRARELSAGQLYLFFGLGRGADIAASFLARTIDKHWNAAPYHLRLALLGSAAFCRSIGDRADQAELISLIEGLSEQSDPFLGSAILDTLQMLGALDDDAEEHRDVVVQNIRDCLARPAHRERHAQAWVIYCSQFDHPYSSAYDEVVQDLSAQDRKTLLEMAAKGASDTSLWLVPLLLDLASLGDPSCCEIFQRWTVLPSQEYKIDQRNDIEAFVVAHVALARLGCSLQAKRSATRSPSAEALAACGRILYWSNRSDLSKEDRSTASSEALNVLMRHAPNAALDVIYMCEHTPVDSLRRWLADEPIVRSIVATFQTEIVQVCRNALLEPGSQVSYFTKFGDFNRSQNLLFAISVLKHYGDSTDRPLLRRYASFKDYGEDAIAALKGIEERIVGHADSIP